MYTLTNNHIRFSLDKNGNLLELTNLATGHNYAGNLGLWRIIYQHDDVLEEEITAENSTPTVSVTANDLEIVYDSMISEPGRVDFSLKIRATMIEDDVHFSAQLQNNSSASIIREFQFPFVKNIALLPTQQFYWSFLGGELIKNLAEKLDKSHTLYMGQDNKAVEMSQLYPGFCATNCYAFGDDRQGLYVGSHDATFQNTLHLLRKRKDAIDAGMVKYPFLHPGQTLDISDYVLSPYIGSWHTAAKKYRHWADSWYKVDPVPASFLGSNGWHRIIMRHQYGKIIFRHDEMPRILKSGLEAGIDTLFMFGWFKGGHDAEYPEYQFDETQGGHDALKAHIRKFRAGGGKLILYFNGQLIDTGTEFYKNMGKRISVKNPNGSEHMEWYPFGGDGTALRLFGNKSFVTACPGCHEWLDHLKGLIDQAVELEVDGVFFDQMGWTSRPCCDPSHGHPVPFMTAVAAKAEMLRQMRDYIKSRRPDMSFGIEWLSDLTAQHVDYVHNVVGGAGVNNNWEKTGEKPDMPLFPEWFRYTFPEVLTTDREIRDDHDIERRVNIALVRGIRSDVEIYRCRALIDETPHYKEYLTAANKLRDRYRDLILNGTFIDTDGFSLDNPELFASAFRHGNRLAIVLTQSHLAQTEANINVPGYSYCESDGLNHSEVAGKGENAKIKLPRHGLAVVIFEAR